MQLRKCTVLDLPAYRQTGGSQHCLCPPTSGQHNNRKRSKESPELVDKRPIQYTQTDTRHAPSVSFARLAQHRATARIRYSLTSLKFPRSREFASRRRRHSHWRRQGGPRGPRPPPQLPGRKDFFLKRGTTGDRRLKLKL